MNAIRSTIPVTTAADGTATAYSPVLSGKVVSITYIPDGATPYDNTVDFTITVEATGQGLWTQSNLSAGATVAPRQPINDLVGGAALYAAGGLAVHDDIIIALDRVKIMLAQGGNAKTGSFVVVTA